MGREMNKKYLCIDVGGTSIKYGIMDTDLNLSSKGSIATPYDGVEAYLNTLEGIYKQFDGQVCGIAMSVPGGIDSKNGICIFGGSLLFIDHLPLVQEMEELFGKENVVLK